jgi:hypothetical protein
MKTTAKPSVKLTGQNGNVFNLMGICSLALKKAGHADLAKEMSEKIFKCGSYDKALQIMMEYCNVK